MIIRDGVEIYPKEVEEFLITHIHILNAQVVGVPDPINGEELMAWVVLKDGAQLDERDVRDFCEGHLQHYKIPKYIEFTDDYPRTASGKIMKQQLKELSVEKTKL